MTCRPLLKIYPGQSTAQPAYLEIRSDGDVAVEYDPEVGGAMPSRVWHKIDCRFPIDPRLKSDQLDALKDTVRPLAEQMLKSSEIRWDGSNKARGFQPEAKALFQKITQICEELEPDWRRCDDEHCGICFEEEEG